MTNKIYNHRECEETIYSDNYAKHVSCMTGEQLHSKMDIAAELAYRDNEIEKLQQEIFSIKAELAITKQELKNKRLN